MTNVSNILIADDHQLVIDGIEKLLSDEPSMQIIGIAQNGQEAIDKTQALKPNIVLMDVDMPVLNGIEATRMLLAKNPNLKIAILSMHYEKTIVESMVKMGVVGYFVKNADKLEFIQGLKLILAGKSYFHPSAMLSVVQPSRKLMATKSHALLLSQLSQREVEVLKLIAQGFSTKEIASQLHLSARTIETHRKNIHHKLEMKNLAGLIRFAVKAGLVD